MGFLERRHFTDEQHKVAGLMALGYDTKDVILQTKCTLSTIKRYKKDPHFIILVQNLRADLHRVAIDEGRDAIARDIRKFRAEYKITSEKLAVVSNAFLEKIHQAMELISPEDISPGNIPAYVRATLDLLKLSEESNQRSLGLDKLLELSDEFEAIIETNRQEPDEFDDSGSTPILEGGKEAYYDAECKDTTEGLE